MQDSLSGLVLLVPTDLANAYGQQYRAPVLRALTALDPALAYALACQWADGTATEAAPRCRDQQWQWIEDHEDGPSWISTLAERGVKQGSRLAQSGFAAAITQVMRDTWGPAAQAATLAGRLTQRPAE